MPVRLTRRDESIHRHDHGYRVGSVLMVIRKMGIGHGQKVAKAYGLTEHPVVLRAIELKRQKDKED